MKRSAPNARGRLGEKLEQGVLASALVPAVAAVLFAAAFLMVPVPRNQLFVELTEAGDMSAYVAASAPDLYLNERGEILVKRNPVPEPILRAYLTTQVPGWDGRAVSIAAHRSLPAGRVLLFARKLFGMGIERIYYVTPDSKLKLLTSVSSARSSNRNV